MERRPVELRLQFLRGKKKGRKLLNHATSRTSSSMEFYVITREMAVSLDRRYKLKQCNNTNLLGKGCLRNFIPMILTFVDRS